MALPSWMEKRYEAAIDLSKSVRDLFVVFISPNWGSKTYDIRFSSVTLEEAEMLTEYFSEMRGNEDNWRAS